jgi:hypothetical protein
MLASTSWELLSAEQRDMRGNHPPSLSQTDPRLALAASDDAAFLVSFELEVDAAEITSEGGYIEARDAAGEIGRWPRSTKGGNLLDAVQILGRAETNYIRRRPEETLHRPDIVIHQCGFVVGIESSELGDGFRIIDDHS